MEYLYHGSGYFQEELKPGISYTGIKVTWDKTESNEYLYATTVLEEAIAQGFCSVVEKHWKLSRFTSMGSKLVFYFDDNLPSLEDLKELDVYLYTIIRLPEHEWIAVNNLHNNMDNEFKTKKNINKAAIKSVEKIDLKKWLSGKQVYIKHKNASLEWHK